VRRTSNIDFSCPDNCQIANLRICIVAHTRYRNAHAINNQKLDGGYRTVSFFSLFG
jgi:hypothetical protein